MTLARNLIDDAAALLFAADAGRAPIGPLTERFPKMDLADAYAVQQVNLTRRLRAGRVVVGPQDRPDLRTDADPAGSRRAGLRLHPRRHGGTRPGGGARRPLLRTPRRTGSRLPASRSAERTGCDTRRRARGDRVGGGRARDRRQPHRRLEADAARYGRRQRQFRCGGTRSVGSRSTGLDLPSARASLQLNGTEIDSGLGSAVLGDPAAAVAWLANALAPFGTDLLPGQFIMSGSFTAAAFVHPGDSASATISGLGTVSLTFT